MCGCYNGKLFDGVALKLLCQITGKKSNRPQIEHSAHCVKSFSMTARFQRGEVGTNVGFSNNRVSSTDTVIGLGEITFLLGYLLAPCTMMLIISAELHLVHSGLVQQKRAVFLDLFLRYCVYEIFRPSTIEQASDNSVEAT